MKLGTLAAICACLLFIGCDPVEDGAVVPTGGNAGEGGAAGAGGGEAGAAGAGGGEAGAAGAGGGEAGTAGAGGGEAGTAGAGGGEAGTAGAGGGEAGTAGAGGGEAGTAGAGGGEAGSGGMMPCKDVDRDGECDDVDSLCNADGMPLMCRRATPDCPPNTVPETRNGCFTDRCVTWEECGDIVPSDMPCGGIAGIQCPDGFFCNYPIDAMCGAGDMQGLCMPFEPDGPCTRELFWVCGCDGETYGNECEALRAGTSVASVGQCDSEPVICGTRGAPPCADGEYCKHPIEANCGRTDMPGVCMPFDPTMPCTREYFPVCGCDGQTYSNPCHAEVAGVSIDFEGPCASEGVACTVDGNQCERNEFCAFPTGAFCGERGGQGICQAVPDQGVCTREVAPVCGCDGQTYTNECEALVAGVSIRDEGACGDGCMNDADCGPTGWCRPTGEAEGMACTPYQSEGDSCGGFTLPEFQTRCSPDLFCSNEQPLLPDAPGICRPLCLVDEECGNNMTCNITSDTNPNGPCLSSCAPGEPCIDLCYGYCVPMGQSCGGFLGLPCPGDQVCMDDPSDQCDPQNGGADCPGICGEPNACTPDQCGPAPRLMLCENGEAPIANCVMGVNGMCGWEIDTSPCEEEPIGCREGDCGPNGYCQLDRNGAAVCIPYALDGDPCGGGIPPGPGTECNPATHYCAPPAVDLPGAPGICSAYCMGDDDCGAMGSTCIINPPCLSPEGNNLAVCYGYCSPEGDLIEPPIEREP